MAITPSAQIRASALGFAKLENAKKAALKSCEGDGSVLLYRKGEANPFQAIKLSNISGDGRHVFYNPVKDPTQKEQRSPWHTVVFE